MAKFFAGFFLTLTYVVLVLVLVAYGYALMHHGFTPIPFLPPQHVPVHHK